MSSTKPLLIIYWKWAEGTKSAGVCFWGCHGTDLDGRILDWPNEGLIPIAATAVDAAIVEGVGLELLTPIAERTRAWNEAALAPKKDQADLFGGDAA